MDDEGESSVISEIVEEKVVELEDSAFMDNNGDPYMNGGGQLEKSNEREQRIKEYLDVDKDQYLNNDEYAEAEADERNHSNEWSQNRATDNMQDGQGYQAEGHNDYRYQDTSPIQENEDEEMTASKQGQYLTQQENQARYYNEKAHLIWEQERLMRKRIDYERRNDPMTLHQFFKDPSPQFSTSTTRGKVMEYDFTKPSKKSDTHINHLKSRIPMLSDHYKNSKTHQAAASSNLTPFENLYYGYISNKKDSGLSSIFNQSEYQQRLGTSPSSGGKKAPASHSSLNKNVKDFNTAKFNVFQSVAEGRQRMFYSSQIF